MILFIENTKGKEKYINNVYNVKIMPKNNELHLFVFDKSLKCIETLKLSEIEKTYLIDIVTSNEYFRYEK